MKAKECPTCKKKLAGSDFEWHLLHGHDVGGPYDKPYEDDGDHDFYEEFNTVDFLQKNLDATKDIGYPCRERGSYGSPSSHDGFEDESDS